MAAADCVCLPFISYLVTWVTLRIVDDNNTGQNKNKHSDLEWKWKIKSSAPHLLSPAVIHSPHPSMFLVGYMVELHLY